MPAAICYDKENKRTRAAAAKAAPSAYRKTANPRARKKGHAPHGSRAQKRKNVRPKRGKKEKTMQIRIARTGTNAKEKATLFGDSIPKGLYLEGNKVRRIGRCAVDTVAQTLGIEIENRSAFGMTLAKCVEKGYISDYIKNAGDGDVAVFSLGGNDCDYDWEKVARDPFAYHTPRTPLPLFEELLDDTARALKKAGIRAFFTNLTPISSERYFKNVISARADGAEVMKFFAGDVTNIARHQESYSNAVTKAALSNGFPLFDCRTEFLMKPDMLDFLSDDGIHPNQAGHDLIAECILRRAESLPSPRRAEGTA